MRLPFENKKTLTPAAAVAFSGMLTALAMIFSYVESLVPLVIPIPGVKLGLANLVTLTGLFYLSPWNVLAVMVCRIFLSGLMFGNLSTIVYSLAGGFVSFLVMIFLKKIGLFSVIGISIAGGVFHNFGQLLVACLVLDSTAPAVYLPYLVIAGAVCGGLMGIVAKLIFKAFR